MRRVFALGFLYFAYAACAASHAPAASAAEPSARPNVGAPPKKAPGAPASASAAPAAAPRPRAEKPSETRAPGNTDVDDAACPDGMQLVEGEYCSKVEHKCLKQWHDKANDKDVCEEFEPTSTCVGEKTKKRYCMDTYTWPNEKGARPE